MPQRQPPGTAYRISTQPESRPKPGKPSARHQPECDDFSREPPPPPSRSPAAAAAAASAAPKIRRRMRPRQRGWTGQAAAEPRETRTARPGPEVVPSGPVRARTGGHDHGGLRETGREAGPLSPARTPGGLAYRPDRRRMPAAVEGAKDPCASAVRQVPGHESSASAAGPQAPPGVFRKASALAAGPQASPDDGFFPDGLTGGGSRAGARGASRPPSHPSVARARPPRFR